MNRTDYARVHGRVAALVARKAPLSTIITKLKQYPATLVIEAYDEIRTSQFDVERTSFQ